MNNEQKLLKTMNGTINNICKWADKEFVEPKKTSRDVLLSLDKDEEFNNEDFEKKIKIINSLFRLIQARADMENNFTDDTKK